MHWGMVGQAVWPVAGDSRQFVLDIHPTIAFRELCIVVITQYINTQLILPHFYLEMVIINEHKG